MIVYQVKGSFSLKKRTIKKRISDKNKRIYDNFHKRKGQRYWWKEIE